MNVGFAGTGIMGAPMARNLLRAGVDVTVWNRDRAKLEPLVAEGAASVDSLAELASGKDAVITMVADGSVVESLLFRGDGIADAMKTGSLFIDMSTIEPERARTIAARLGERGIDALDAPVSGGERGAIDGTLAIMAGGTEATFERARPLFEAMGRNIVRVGHAGAGQIAKTCNQLIVTMTIEAVAEALALARAAGVDPARVREAMRGGFADSRILELHGARMIEGDYRPGGAIKHHLKDRDAALGTARAAQMNLPAAEVVFARIAEVVERGDGELDHSALYTLFTR